MKVLTAEQFTGMLLVLMSTSAGDQHPDEEDGSVKEVLAGCMAIMKSEKLVNTGVEVLNSALADESKETK